MGRECGLKQLLLHIQVRFILIMKKRGNYIPIPNKVFRREQLAEKSHEQIDWYWESDCFEQETDQPEICFEVHYAT